MCRRADLEHNQLMCQTATDTTTLAERLDADTALQGAHNEIAETLIALATTPAG